MSMSEPQAELYVARKPFKLPGNPEVNIRVGDTIGFDGMQVFIPGLPPRNLPQIRGAINQRWLVAQEAYDSSEELSPPVSAGMTIRPADGGNPMGESRSRTAVTTVQENERYVGNVAQHAAEVRENNKSNYRVGQTVEVASQEGVVVRQLGSPDGRKSPVDMSLNGSTAIAEANNRKIQAGPGRSREEVMAQMTPEQRAQYEAEIQARRAMHGVPDQKTVVVDPSTRGVVVGRVKTQTGTFEKEGMMLTNQVGGGLDIADLGGTSGAGSQSKTTVVESEGIKFTQTNIAKKSDPKPQDHLERDPRRVIAKSICSDFPEVYDFDTSARKKIARLQADFEDRPDIIRAVAAAETDAEVRQRLVQEFPDAFPG